MSYIYIELYFEIESNINTNSASKLNDYMCGSLK